MAIYDDDLYWFDEEWDEVLDEEWDENSPYYKPESRYERDLKRKQEEGYFGSDFEE